MEIVTAKNVETLPGTEIVRVDGVWWRIIWDDSAEVEEKCPKCRATYTTERDNFIAGKEPSCISDLLNTRPLGPWRPGNPDVWDFLMEELAESDNEE